VIAVLLPPRDTVLLQSDSTSNISDCRPLIYLCSGYTLFDSACERLRRCLFYPNLDGLWSCFKVRAKRTNEWIPVLRASSIQRWRVATLPPRRIARKLRTSLCMTAKPGHCRFSASTIRACWLVNSARTLLNSAAATCGDSCLDPVEIVGSSCDASGNAEIALWSLLLAGATAKGILPGPRSNRRNRAYESPPIAGAHADNPPPNADANNLGTIRAFPGAAASGFFPAARRAGSIRRCAVDIGQVASRFDLLSCQRPSFA
jgi:hypothetical protein